MKTPLACGFVPISPAAAADTVMAGMFSHTAQVSTFQPYNSDRVMWLDGEGDAMSLLEGNAAAATRGTGRPHAPIRVAISARESRPKG